MSETKSYVRLDENGVLRVGAGRVMLDSVVAAFQQGHSAETIRQNGDCFEPSALASFVTRLKKLKANR